MTRGGGKRAAIGAALLLIALAGVAALASVDTGNSGGASLAAAQATTDYDDDDDRLIDIRTLAQLNAIRWDLNGDGAVAAANAANYLTAFPNRDTAAATRMGCPSPGCKGYELRADLDFDTDDDGDVDSSDTYPHWVPLGTFTAEFEGNNNTISNMNIGNINSAFARVGFFTTNSGTITGVGMVNATAASSGGAAVVGVLAASNTGTVRSSYATGSVSATGAGGLHAGGLAGYNSGTIAASWSGVNVSAAGSLSHLGGLAGRSVGGTITASYAVGAVSTALTGNFMGGLVGTIESGTTIRASYAAGPMSGAGAGSNAGGLYESATGSNTIAASYWDTGMTGIPDDADSDMPEGATTSALQSITSYTGVFADWNANVNGVTGADDPWNFGTAMQYPRLKFGFDADGQAAQGSLVMGTPGTNGDNPVVGQIARVCLVAGPTQRAAGTGGVTYQPWQWYRSADGVSWGSALTNSGATYEYMPASGDANNYLRACVDVVSSTNAERVLGEDRVCVGPFAKVQASGS